MFVGFVLFVVVLTDHVDFQIRVELLMHSAINSPQKCNLWEGNVFFYNFKNIVLILSILHVICIDMNILNSPASQPFGKMLPDINYKKPSLSMYNNFG